MRFSTQFAVAIGAAAISLLAISGCSGSPSTTSALPSQQLSLGHVDPAVSTRPTEILNQFNAIPTGPPPTNFEVVLKGNLVTALCGPTNPPCLQQPLYGPYNPFCPPGQGPSNPCYPIVTYDPTTNTTTVSFAGPILYNNIGGHPGQVHFGLFATAGAPGWVRGLELTSYFSYPSSTPNPQPVVSVNWQPLVRKSSHWKYAQVFVEVSLTKGGQAAYGTWNEVPYVPKGTTQPKISFTNYGTKPLYVTRSGIIPNGNVPTDPSCVQNLACPEDMALLQMLNFAGSPPPGDPGSMFQPLQFPPAQVLKPTKES